MNKLVITGVLGVVGFALIQYRKAEREGRNRLLSERRPLSDHELFEQFFDASHIKEVDFVAAWHKAAKVLEVDPSLLRPDDNLEKLSGIPKWIGSNGFTRIDNLIAEIETHLRRRHVPIPESVSTVKEAVLLLSS